MSKQQIKKYYCMIYFFKYSQVPTSNFQYLTKNLFFISLIKFFTLVNRPEILEKIHETKF